jgi:hypothetical protein
VSWQAWRAFARIAAREVASPGTQHLTVRAGAAALVLARRFGTPGGASVEVACTLHYDQPVDEFAEEHDEGPLQPWLDRVAACPQWRRLNALVPTALTLAGEPVFNSRVVRAGHCPTNA